jgi:hypothetical protein
MSSPLHRSDALAERAYAIADEAMQVALNSYCALTLEEPAHRYLVDEDGCEVKQFCDAATEIREAFDYLAARGLAELRSDDHGEYIVLKEPA